MHYPPKRDLRVEKRIANFDPGRQQLTFEFAVFNMLTRPLKLELFDPLPPQLDINPATLPPSFELVPPNILYGQFSFSQTEVLTVAVPATLAGLECVTNQAYWRTDIGLEGHTNPVQFLCADLGDAPDSTNHHGITNTAYFLTGTVVLTPDVAGQFPTVWESPPTEPSGPRHLDAGQAWLGNFVSHEDEADLGPDVDGPNNILNAGFDNANSDGGDDGWLNRQTPFPHCQESTLKVRVFKARPGLRHMFLNVWFDGTRDGDWNDIVPCDDQRHAFEWIVQNFVIDMHAWPPGTFRDIVVPTFLIANAKPDMPAWVRFTLSESPPPSLTNAELADGRGPHFPAAFRIGETEDYLIPGHPAGGFPGEVSIAKTASASAVQVGQVFTYSVYLTHTGGTAPVLVEMFDELPPPVELVDGPTVTELNPVANPLFAFFDAGHGPSGAVGWRGFLSPDAALRVDFAVRVKHCPPEGVAIHNVAVADLIGGGQLFADVTTPITCTPPRPPNITLTKRIIPDVGPPLTDWTTVPGEHIVYRLELSGTVDLTRTVIISDPMQPGVIAVAADASTGVAHVINGGQTVIWEGELTPGAPHAIVKILARLQDVQCGQVIENVAFWRTPFFGGNASNITHLRLDCHDLGDAPDSTNHFPGALMTAYPGITATFPTVFTATVPAGPPGPVHLRPQPLHLGPRVSFEIEADLGFDLDGRNNLEPVLDTPNLDKSDDGLDLDLLTFAHCKPLRFPVWVSIGPDAIAALGQEGTGYLNVWLDSNRDGDWADTFDCPPDPGTNFSVAREHIVIDQPVDVAALGPGLHKIFVETTSLVHWPDALRDKPAWLRLTLSDRPSNKPFGGYGDGRGYKNPFKLGETEDYLLRGPDEPPQADPTVEKEGFLHPFFRYNPQQPDREEMVWAVNWLVEYANVGHAVANNTKLIDTFDDRQQLDEAHSYPFILPGVAGNTLTYAIGALNPGQGGHIFIRTTVPFTTPPGTVLTNTVTITAANDGNPANNTRVVTQAIPLLPPRITYPRPGTTCTGTITVTGRSQIGSFVDLYVNGVYTATATVDPTTGAWAVPLSLPDGTHIIQAQARVASGPTSPMSPPVEVVVDSSLVWSPLSLHFTFEDETGGKHVIIPKDQNGRTDESGWFVFLRPGFSYTATVFICCDDPNASVTLAVPGGQTVNLTDPDDDGWFEGTFTQPSEGSLLTPPTIRLCVVCYNIQYCSDGKVLIDPEGVVYDVDIGPQSGLLSGAVAACYEAQTSIDSGQTTYGLWPAEDFSQVNPQTTASDGYFSFFTPAGTFQLDVTKTGYQSYRSWDIVVVDDPVEFNVPLAKIITQTAAYTVTISDAGFDPAVLTVVPGAVIQWVNIDGNQHTTTSLTPTVRTTTTARLAAPGPTDGWDSGLLNSGAVYKRQLNTIGQYSYYDHQNSAYTGLVIVQATNTVDLPLSIKN
ncbi:MAG: hypothetical protein ACE5G8_04495 [Anaerolineae bacterium]